MKKIINYFTFGLLILVLSGCKKIATPNEECKKIFGKWDYISDTGGMSGAGGSNKYCEDCWIEITDKGNFNVYDGQNKKIKSYKFTIEMITRISDHTLQPAIVYKSGWTESFIVNDSSLLLSEEAYDGFSYAFVKK